MFRQISFLGGAAGLLAGLALATPQFGLDNAEPIAAFLDGGLPSGTPDTSFGNWVLEDAYPNLRFRDPLTFTPEPGTNRIFVGSRQGVIEVFENSPSATSTDVFLDLTDDVGVVWDGGFLGHAFHPEWGQAGSPNRNYFYVYYCYAAPGAVIPPNFSGSQSAYFFDCYLRLSRFTKPDGSSAADPGSEQVMFNVRLFNGSHRGGGMFFADDGFLHISIGDQFRYTTAQNIQDNFEGGVVRIDVDSTGGSVSHPPLRRMGQDAGFSDELSGVGYYIPNDNPFLDSSGGNFEEFWTVGHRNPHRMTLDVPTNRIWSGEVGQNAREEINVIEGGHNYQWPFMEGTQSYIYPAPSNPLGVEQPPVLDFPHSEANAIIGGYVYRGSTHPELFGKYICGGYDQSRIWALTYDSVTNTATKEYLLNFTPGSLCTFGQDHAGEVYLCGLGNNTPIRRLARDDGYPEAPQLLSQTGAFSNLSALTPRAGLVPYGVNTALWSDGAIKRRWIAVPNDGNPNTPDERIGYSEEGEWTFPVGTTLVKHFETPEGRRLETRMFVHGEDNWYGVTYRWDANGLDAQLLSDGLVENLTIGGADVDYYYPSRSDCLVCHRAQAGSVLGLKTRQLNGDFTYPSSGVTDNQLRTLSHLGLLHPPVADADLPDKLTNVALTDAAAPLELRVRSYLDANCSQCHRPGQGHSTIDARATQSLAFQGIINGGVTEDLGISGARVVKPGDLSRSILYQRINSVEGCCAMPPLARGLIDPTAVSLLEQWIESLDTSAIEGSVAQSTTDFGGVATRAIDVNLDGVYNNGSVTHTNSGSQQYWQADLGTEFFLERVRLWNRTDCCEDRLSNFYLFVSPNPFTGTSVQASLNQAGVHAVYYPGEVSLEEFIDVGELGRYVRIQRNQSGVLSLAEAQFFGYTPNAGVVSATSLTSVIADGFDDAEERTGASGVYVDSSDIELGFDGSQEQLVGLRFALNVPPAASIASAHLQFTTDEVSTGAASYIVEVQAADDAEPIFWSFQNLSSRPRGQDQVSWSPAPWPSVGAAGPDQRSPDLKSLVQSIVSRPGWQPGNHVLFLISGSGERTAEAFEGADGAMARLEVTYGGLASNSPPTVDAGPDRTGGIDTPVTLLGAFADDDPGSVTLTWQQLAGRDSAQIESPGSAQTNVICSQAGIYTFRLEATDGEFTVSDDVQVVISSGSQQVTSRVAASADDGEQRLTEYGIHWTSSDLELGMEHSQPKLVGMRFALDVPQGATLQDARVEFTADELGSNPSNLQIKVVAADSAGPIARGSNDLLSRPLVPGQVAWSPPAWTTVHASGPNETSTNFAALLQQVIDRPGWSAGQYVMVLFEGTGMRTAESFEGDPALAPLLRVSWQ